MPVTRSLVDPVIFGEDLQGNLQRVVKLAPGHCSGCADYHIRNVAHRVTGEKFGIDLDRRELVAAVRDIVGGGLSRQERINIVIAGSADTGVLATVAHAVALHGDEALRRCRFTVLDLCPTPLLLCKHFSQEHGLDFACETVDLTAPGKKFPADIIVMHSVFRFIDSGLQPAVLAELGAWLNPGGSMVFSNRVKSTRSEESAADLANREARNRRFAAMSARGEIDVAADPQAITASLDRSKGDHENRAGEFRSAADVRRLLDASPLNVVQFDEIVREIGDGAAQRYNRTRVLAVLRATG